MYIQIHHAGIEVREADDLQQLNVRADGVDDDVVAEKLAEFGIGTGMESGHVFLHIERLRRLAHASIAAPDWHHRWHHMVDYAQKREWISPDGQYVRAHIERLE